MTEAPLKVTIKYGKGYEDTWAVFTDYQPEALRDSIINFFGIRPAAVEGFTLHDVVVVATNIAQGIGAVQEFLGGTHVPADDPGVQVSQEPAPAAAPGEDPWAKAEEQAPQTPPARPTPPVREEKDPLIEQIEAATTKKELQRLWAANQAKFKASEQVQAAFQARMSAIA